MKLVGFLILAAFLSTAVGQQTPAPKPGTRLELKFGVPGEPPPLKPEPGDNLIVEEGYLVIEHLAEDGSIARYRVERSTRIDPQIEARYEALPNGLIRYTYRVTNGPKAAQVIRDFAVGMVRPDLVSGVEAPEGWWCVGPSLASPGFPSRYTWGRLTDQGGVAPGRSAAGFAFQCPALPGLGRAYLSGHVERRAFPLEKLSPWLLEQYARVMTYLNETVHPLVIAPKIYLYPESTAADVISSVAEELGYAAGLPQFRKDREELLKLREQLASAERAAIPAVSAALKAPGAEGFKRALFDALAFDLEHALRLR